MPMNDKFTRLASVGVLLIVGLFVVSSVFGSIPASETRTIENESIAVNYTEPQQVDVTYGETYLENETVYNSTGAVLVEGTDYEWYTDNQTVVWYNTANTSNGSSGNITYSFEQRPSMARNAMGPISSAYSLGAVALIVLVAALILGLVGGFGSNNSGGRR